MSVRHWEAYPSIGKRRNNTIYFLVERSCGCAELAKVENKAAEFISTSTIKRLKAIVKRVRILNRDNEKEFGDYVEIEKGLGSISHVSYPYSGWQRGSIEDRNLLMRRYTPRSRSYQPLALWNCQNQIAS